MLEYTVVEADERSIRFPSVKRCDNVDCGRRIGKYPTLISYTQLGPKGFCDVCAIQEIASSMQQLAGMLEQVRTKKR